MRSCQHYYVQDRIFYSAKEGKRKVSYTHRVARCT